MNKFTAGIIAGGVLSVVGVSLMLNESKLKRKMVRTGHKAMDRAGDFIDEVGDML